jgi:hypothetical protein
MLFKYFVHEFVENSITFLLKNLIFNLRKIEHEAWNNNNNSNNNNNKS